MKRTVDPARVGKYHEATGIYVLAYHNGKRGPYDIAELDRDSLHALVTDSHDFAIGVVMTLLRHPQTLIEHPENSNED